MRLWNCVGLILSVNLLCAVRVSATPAAVTPFSDPDPFSAGKQLSADEQREIDAGVKLLHQHKQAEAVAWFREHARTHPDRWWLDGILSRLLLIQGSYQEAYKGYFQSRLQIYTVD